jgi:hypothetical protein
MLYLVLSVIAILMAIMKRMSMMTIVVKTVFVLLWTWFLNFLCSKGYSGISWFLVLLPFIFLVMAVVCSVEMMSMVSRR